MNKVLKISTILILALIFCSACNYGEIKKEGDGSDKSHYYITPTPEGNSQSLEIDTDLPTCNIEQIRLLTSSYYSALKNGSAEQLANLVQDPTAINDEVFDAWEGVSGISVKHVYMLEGASPIDYIVYVYYELKIEGTTKTIPSLDELYINYSNDMYYVINGSVSATAYNEVQRKINGNEGVNNLVTSVNRLFEEAVSSDETVKNFVETRKQK